MYDVVTMQARYNIVIYSSKNHGIASWAGGIHKLSIYGAEPESNTPVTVISVPDSGHMIGKHHAGIKIQQ